MTPQRAGEACRAAASFDDFANIHSYGVWDIPSLVVNRIEGETRTRSEGPRHNPVMSKPRVPRLDIRRTPLAQRLVDLRLERGLTQAELAEAAGISRAHLGKMESGGDIAGRASLQALAVFFGVSMDWLQSGSHPAPSPQDGRLVQDPEQIAVLDIWEAIPRNERPRIANMLRAAALDPAKSG